MVVSLNAVKLDPLKDWSLWKGNQVKFHLACFQAAKVHCVQGLHAHLHVEAFVKQLASFPGLPRFSSLVYYIERKMKN